MRIDIYATTHIKSPTTTTTLTLIFKHTLPICMFDPSSQPQHPRAGCVGQDALRYVRTPASVLVVLLTPKDSAARENEEKNEHSNPMATIKGP
jgi:hypothetical protein